MTKRDRTRKVADLEKFSETVDGAAVLLPVVTASEMNRRDHWSVVAARKRDQHAAVRWLVPRKPCPIPCVVTLTRVGPRRLDCDNLRSALKFVRDGVAERLGVDDADPRVMWEYAQEVGPYGVRVRWRSWLVVEGDVA